MSGLSSVRVSNEKAKFSAHSANALQLVSKVCSFLAAEPFLVFVGSCLKTQSNARNRVGLMIILG